MKKTNLEQLRALVKTLSGSAGKAEIALKIGREGNDKGVMIEESKTQEIRPRPEPIHAPFNADTRPESLEGIGIDELLRMDCDGELTETERAWFYRKKGRIPARNYYPQPKKRR